MLSLILAVLIALLILKGTKAVSNMFLTVFTVALLIAVFIKSLQIIALLGAVSAIIYSIYYLIKNKLNLSLLETIMYAFAFLTIINIPLKIGQLSFVTFAISYASFSILHPKYKFLIISNKWWFIFCLFLGILLLLISFFIFPLLYSL